MKRGILFFWGAIILIIIVAVGASFFSKSSGPSKYDAFAQCITQKGIKFYGAFWCPHCQRTKGQFGTAVQYLPYVECSTPDGQGQTQICKDMGIQEYPTWVSPATTTRLSGEHTMEELSAFTGCPLPQS